jgi:hypothetical protein
LDYLQTEFDEVVKVEVGAIINQKDELTGNLRANNS